MCFVCGMENEYGLKASFFELENDQLVGTFKPCKFHQGYPGRLHGGIASTILDEAMGRSISLNQHVKVICSLTSENSRLFEGEGKIVLENGDAAVIAKGKYIKMPLDKITKNDFVDDQWFMVESKDDPTEIEI